MVHLQYDTYEIVSVLLFGLLLGYARLKTNSILVPVIMHAVNNLAATMEVAVYIRYLR